MTTLPVIPVDLPTGTPPVLRQPCCGRCISFVVDWFGVEHTKGWCMVSHPAVVYGWHDPATGAGLMTDALSWCKLFKPIPPPLPKIV